MCVRVHECMYASMHTMCIIPPKVGMLSQALIHEFVGKQRGNECVQFEVSLSNNNAQKICPLSSEIKYKKVYLIKF